MRDIESHCFGHRRGLTVLKRLATRYLLRAVGIPRAAKAMAILILWSLVCSEVALAQLTSPIYVNYLPKPTISSIQSFYPKPEPNPYRGNYSNPSISFWFSATRAAEFGDFRGTGAMDMLIAPNLYSYLPEWPIMLWANDGAGNFSDQTSSTILGTIPVTGAVNSILIADFNGDGRADAAFMDQGLEVGDCSIIDQCSGHKNEIILSQPTDKLSDTTATSFPGQLMNFTHPSSVGYLAGRGYPDILDTRLGGRDKTKLSGQVFLLNDGKGVFTESLYGLPLDIGLTSEAYPGPLFNPDAPVDRQNVGTNYFGDLDETGETIVVSSSLYYNPENGGVIHSPAGVRFYKKDTLGNFKEVQRLRYPAPIEAFRVPGGNPAYPQGDAIIHIRAADLDGSGLKDLVMRFESPGSPAIPMQYRSGILVYKNLGNLQFRDETVERLGTYFLQHSDQYGIANFDIRDINGDGLPDIVLRLANGSSIANLVNPNETYAYVNDGAGHFAPWLPAIAGKPATADSIGGPSSANCTGDCTPKVVLMPFFTDASGDGLDDLVLIDHINDGTVANRLEAGPRTTNVNVFIADPAYLPSTPVRPETGWYWIPSENGRWFFIEQRNRKLYVSGLIYDAKGNPSWFSASGALANDNSFTSPMQTYQGGTTLTGDYKAPTQSATLGTLSLKFLNSRKASVTWPGGSGQIERYGFAPKGNFQQILEGTPHSGFWRSEQSVGPTLAIEMKGGNLFMSGFMFGADGKPLWYSSSGTMVDAITYRGNWSLYGGGSPLEGTYKPPVIANANAGSVQIVFNNARNAQMLTPDGRSIRLVNDFPPPITPASSFTGLWWNANESGWGMSVTQHASGNIFAAWYVYDANGKPIWYVMPACSLSGKSCTSDIYSVVGGMPLGVTWSGTGIAPTKVGSGTLSFSDNDTATYNYSLNGVTGSKNLTRQPISTGTSAPLIDYSDLWWNANESGWGVSLSQQFGMIFVALYTYDAKGQPIWYVASSCPLVGNGCTGTLYQVIGNTPPTVPWNSAKQTVTAVGSVGFVFADSSIGTMQYTINGVTGTKAISRQPF